MGWPGSGGRLRPTIDMAGVPVLAGPRGGWFGDLAPRGIRLLGQSWRSAPPPGRVARRGGATSARLGLRAGRLTARVGLAAQFLLGGAGPVGVVVAFDAQQFGTSGGPVPLRDDGGVLLAGGLHPGAVTGHPRVVVAGRRGVRRLLGPWGRKSGPGPIGLGF